MNNITTTKFNLQRLNIPPATKFLLILLTFFSILLQFIKFQTYKQLILQGEKNIDSNYIVVPILQLIPNQIIWHPWTLTTSIFIDLTIWRFLLSFIQIFIGGKFIERSWSSKELIKFIILICSISNFITILSLIFIGLFINLNYIDIPIDGNLSLLISFLVVFKQLIPEHSIVLFKGTIHARIKHLPFLILIILSIISILTISITPLLQSWIGFLISWIYLRFYQNNIVDPLLPQSINDQTNTTNSNSNSNLKGDASEIFSLIHFFPNFLHPILSPIFNQIYQIFINLKILPKFNDLDIENGNLIANRRLTGQQPSQPIDSRNAAERRRQVALKVLEERIGEDLKKPEIQGN
ncbi:hypothetical protein WICMUC_002311 [Wickerhamomyces mucosus]|uniref:Uncharacterized protein n=1 Tax=Wickerhamomyces mucosus TaxID=1378264 RepID=A0A9P8PQV6_9ASCO|nr:hypothetical protein WICMUC_002311 [Wickerhamomyces mucosus]